MSQPLNYLSPQSLYKCPVENFLKGKSSIWVAQNIANKQRNFVGHKFWARGYFVSTVGINEKVIRAYIENQEKEDKRLDDLFDR
jgi:putative transposase